MDFAQVISAVCGQLDTAGVRYAVTGDSPWRCAVCWNDIRLLLETARDQGLVLDWALRGDYVQLFNLEDKLPS